MIYYSAQLFRVSTDDQNLNLQQDVLQLADCEKIFEDQINEAKYDHLGLLEVFKFACPGDNLVIWRLDRLSRSLSVFRSATMKGTRYRKRSGRLNAGLLSSLSTCLMAYLR